ncbi:hypothetical protein ELS17_17155 [Natrinema altunense]|uniref:Uncharacterized protein n=1 Tax=Natrinema altunense TaxID=222984 RepID=A0A482XTU8_9EURY|nr:hypothetical protein ELS17_17155 [Natrinema altunense]
MSCCLPLTDSTLLPFVDRGGRSPAADRTAAGGDSRTDGGTPRTDRVGGWRPDTVDGYSTIETT